jgi:hypothetical protein
MFLCFKQYNEVGEALEPFNLKGEREEGYFDVNGNFVWRQQGEEPDAWLVVTAVIVIIHNNTSKTP